MRFRHVLPMVLDGVWFQEIFVVARWAYRGLDYLKHWPVWLQHFGTRKQCPVKLEQEIGAFSAPLGPLGSNYESSGGGLSLQLKLI